MSGLPRFLCVALAAAAVVACGKVQPIASPDAHVDAQFELPDAHPAKGPCDAPVALEDFANCVDQEYCTKLAECGFGSFGDTNCKDLPIELLSGINGPAFATAVQGSIDGGRGAYDPDAAGQCLAMLDGLACRDLFGNNNPLEACGMLIGKVPATEACALPFECVSGSACVYVNGNSFNNQCGTNVCKPRVGAGNPCVNAPCMVGDYCIYIQDAAGARADRCAHGDVGAQCNYDQDCDSGFFCNYPVAGTHTDGAGTCAGALPANAACDRDQMCADNLLCVGDGLTPPSGTCTDVSIPGGTCDSQCFGGLLCSVTGGSTLGACTPPPAEGDPCPASGFCGLVMVCDDKGTPDTSDDTCQTPGDPGATCASGGDCNLGLVCTTEVSGQPMGTCVEPFIDGTACNSSDQCASGSCFNDVCEAFQGCVP